MGVTRSFTWEQARIKVCPKSMRSVKNTNEPKCQQLQQQYLSDLQNWLLHLIGFGFGDG